MNRVRWGAACLAGVVGLVLSAGSLVASDGDDVTRLAKRIDELLAVRQAAESVRPAAIAGDAEFLRRVHLDLGGRIPPVSRVRDFLDDRSSNKRRAVVDELLDGALYVTHYTNVWRRVLMPETTADAQTRFLLPGFEAWLRQKLAGEVSYAEIVREIVTVPLGAGTTQPQQLTGRNRSKPSPLAFYQAKQIKPENLAASTARMFLGIRLECAQCHDHPFDAWKREQFWSFAAFYAGMERQGRGGFLGAIREVADRRDLQIPGTEKTVTPLYLDGSKPDARATGGSRQVLADWMISAENPYFSRTAVNRLWAELFGYGLVDPPDDFTAANPPSHPKLLDELAAEFSAHGFDLKFLVRSLCATRAYQRTSVQAGDRTQDPRLFTRMVVKALSPEQLYDSLSQATGYYQPNEAANPPADPQASSPRDEFLEMFRDEASRPIERRTTILQALALMNGRFITVATSIEQSRTLAAVVEFPLLDTEGRVEALYLAALGRRPRPEELKRLVPYVEGGSPHGDSKRALGDVFWALLNSSEFLFNH